MPKPLPTPDRLFDRTWRLGHPFCPRVSAWRRWLMGIIFTLLCAIIGGYWYLTDANRVREMAQTYLSSLLGGPVKVGDATLSIFEGLRLDNVRLYVDNNINSPDSLLFSANSFLIQYNPRVLLTGKLDATRIVAVDPRVHVTEDLDTGRRNYTRLLESRPATSMPSASSLKPIVLPEIVLRNAQVQYTRVQKGIPIETSSIGIEGQLAPLPEGNAYGFSFQSRGPSSGVGPIISGQMVMTTGKISAKLLNFEFGSDVKAMLPPEVRQWWEQHDLSGRLSIPELTYTPPSPGGRPGYRVEIELEGVTLAVHPEEWMGDEEHRALRGMHRAFDALRIAGLNHPDAPGRDGFVDHLARLVEPAPLSLKQVHGRFIFSDDQSIRIDDLNGWLEEIPFKIAGKIMGYTPAAPAHVRIASSDLHDIEIPAAPRYLNSLPPAVREIYDRFKPRGVCRFWVDLDRPSPGARPRVGGEIEIVDGNFAFEQFPYPLRQVQGKLAVVSDPQSGLESLRLDHIHGLGIQTGPNAGSTVDINGDIGPLGPEARVDVLVSGQKIVSEPALVAAFPSMTRNALTLFDAQGKGEFPKFAGDFACQIIRLRGRESHWIIQTNIHLDDAAGSLVAFPYPMSGVSGDLKIHDDNVELTNIAMKKGDAELRIDGRVSWPRTGGSSLDEARAPRADTAAPASAPMPILKPDLRVVARNVPIDRDLLNALPPQRRAWLEKIGAGGRFDLEGTIKSVDATSGASVENSATRDGDAAAQALSPQPKIPNPVEPGSNLDFDFRIALHDGTLWPQEGTFAVSDVEGNLRLTNQRLTLGDVRGRRGHASLWARGEISWPTEPATVVLQAQATDLALDSSLYRALPPAAQAAWDQVRPEGSVDVSFNYSGRAGETASSLFPPGASAAPTSQPAVFNGYELLLTPRNLSATPLAVPYRLDQLAGTIDILPDKVMIKDLSVRHGGAKLRIGGTGVIGSSQPQEWDFTLAAQDVPVDDDLRNALPQSLANLFKSIQLQGKIGFDFSKLRVAFAPRGAADATSATTQGTALPYSDVDFSLSLVTDGASIDVGVPLSNVKGVIRLAGSSRKGKLAALDGSVDVDSLSLAARKVSRFQAVVVKPSDIDQLTIGKMQAQLAGGSMAGQVDYAFPDAGPSRYALNLILRNADVRDLAGETDQNIQGQVSASLALEGLYNQPGSRRGRGDVSVQGQQMYKIPLVLGLLQITNLALPITSPFTEASVRYSIEGMRVTFEQIELRSKEMLMQGDGHLDFDNKQVSMNFVTDSTAWPKLPVIGDIIQGARHELLQIHVRGTLQEPKVSAGSMNTVTTTVDEVLKGEAPPSQSTNAPKKPR